MRQQAATAPIARPRSRRASWPFAGVGSDRVNITAKVIRQKPAGANFEATANFRSQPQKRPASVTGQAQSLAALC